MKRILSPLTVLTVSQGYNKISNMGNSSAIRNGPMKSSEYLDFVYKGQVTWKIPFHTH